jgi:hypothetical protein
VVGGPGLITVRRGKRSDLVCVGDEGAATWTLDVDVGTLALTDRGLLASASRKRGSCALLVDPETGRILRDVPAKEGLAAALPDLRMFLTAVWLHPVLQARSFEGEMAVVWEHSYAQTGAEFRGLACEGSRGVVTLLAGGEGHLVCLDLRTGKEIWSTSLRALDKEPSGRWDPAIADGLLVISVEDGTVALRMTDGRKAWHKPVIGIRTVQNGKVYVRGMNWGAAGQPSQIVVLALADGRELWRRDYPEVLKKARGNRLTGYLGVSETHIFCGDDTGTVWAFDGRSGLPVWHHRPKQAAAFASWTIPVIARNRLYIASAGDHPHLLCYEPAAGDAPRVEADEGADEEAGLPFRIERVYARQKLTKTRPRFAPGGAWTVLGCSLGKKGRFFLALNEDAGEGRLWVAEAGDGDVLLKAVRKAFPLRTSRAPAAASRVKPPTRLEVEILASGAGEGGSGRGTWTLSKWMGKEGVPELYVNWSAAEKRGMIAEKDEGERKALLRLFAGLVAR